MTIAKRRFFVTDYMEGQGNIPQQLITFYKTIHKYRYNTLPYDISSSFTNYAYYSYGDVLMLEMSMIIKGHTLKQVAELIDVSYHQLYRFTQSFSRGRLTEQSTLSKKAPAYLVKQVIDYIDDTPDVLKQAISHNRTFNENHFD